MSTPESSRDRMALWALLVNLVPFLIGLAMLGLKYQIGPTPILLQITQIGEFVSFGCLVAGSALTLIAWMRAERPGLGVLSATLLLLLAVGEVVLFFM